jgi:hypothetical protein
MDIIVGGCRLPKKFNMPYSGEDEPDDHDAPGKWCRGADLP